MSAHLISYASWTAGSAIVHGVDYLPWSTSKALLLLLLLARSMLFVWPEVGLFHSCRMSE